MLDACVKKWVGAWGPGTQLTIDESMIGWSGMGDASLTFLPRKPCDLGIMMKTLCCTDSGVMVAAEICEGKELMAGKKWVKEWGQTTATTLRILEPYFGSGKILIGDSWFGSVRCAYNLRKHGIFSVMNVK